MCSDITACACGKDNEGPNGQLIVNVFARDWVSERSVELMWLCSTGSGTGWEAVIL